MVRSRKAIRRKGGTRVKRKQKSRLHHISNSFANEKIAKRWNHAKTLRQNYAKLGLAFDSNGNLAGSKQISEHAIHATKAETDIVELFDLPLGGVDLSVSGKPRAHVSPEDKIYLNKLMNKYGEDYGAMARDIKLNFKQHTRAFLARRCKRLLTYQKEHSTVKVYGPMNEQNEN